MWHSMNKNNITNDTKNAVDKSRIGKGTRDLITFLDHERQGRRGISRDILFTSEKGPTQVQHVHVTALKSQNVSRQNTTHLDLRITADHEMYNRLFVLQLLQATRVLMT